MARILIVEDDPSVRRMLEVTFAAEGYEVETLNDGGSALSRLDDDAADVLILDVMLPGVDGYRLLTDVRDRESWQSTRVVLVTGLSDDADVWRGWSAGADYYLTKPFDLDHLRDIVERLIAGDPVA